VLPISTGAMGSAAEMKVLEEDIGETDSCRWASTSLIPHFRVAMRGEGKGVSLGEGAGVSLRSEGVSDGVFASI